MPSIQPRFVSGKGGGGRLFQLRRDANSRQGAYLKLGANSSIYGIYEEPGSSFRVPFFGDFGPDLKELHMAFFLPNFVCRLLKIFNVTELLA